MCPGGIAAIAPWPAVFQMYSDCSDGYLTQTSLRKYRHVDILLQYGAAEPAAFADVETWKGHMKLVSSFAQLVRKPGGSLLDLGLDLFIIADDAWEALFLQRNTGHLRSLLSPFQSYTIRLNKARVEPVLSVQSRH